LTKDKKVEPTNIMKVAVEIYRQEFRLGQRATFESLKRALKDKLSPKEVGEGLNDLLDWGTVWEQFSDASGEKIHYAIAPHSVSTIKQIYKLCYGNQPPFKFSIRNLNSIDDLINALTFELERYKNLKRVKLNLTKDEFVFYDPERKISIADFPREWLTMKLNEACEILREAAEELEVNHSLSLRTWRKLKQIADQDIWEVWGTVKVVW